MLPNDVGSSLALYMAVKVRLTRKLADCVDGIDISSRRVGEVFALPVQAARLLIAEGWAEMIDRRRSQINLSRARRRSTDAALA